jgi:hypothetical protein
MMNTTGIPICLQTRPTNHTRTPTGTARSRIPILVRRICIMGTAIECCVRAQLCPCVLQRLAREGRLTAEKLSHKKTQPSEPPHARAVVTEGV